MYTYKRKIKVVWRKKAKIIVSLTSIVPESIHLISYSTTTVSLYFSIAAINLCTALVLYNVRMFHVPNGKTVFQFAVLLLLSSSIRSNLMISE